MLDFFCYMTFRVSARIPLSGAVSTGHKKILASLRLTRTDYSFIVLGAGLEPAQPSLAKGF